MRIWFVLVLGLFVFHTAPVKAASLTAKDVEQYIQTIRPVIELDKKYGQIVGEEKVLSRLMAPDPARAFRPHVNALNHLKGTRHEALYGALSDLVGQYGYESVDVWAHKADAVLLAYMANKYEVEQSKLDIPPPEIQLQLPMDRVEKYDRQNVMIEAFKKVSTADKAVVAVYMEEIDKLTAP